MTIRDACNSFPETLPRTDAYICKESPGEREMPCDTEIALTKLGTCTVEMLRSPPLRANGIT